MRLTNRLTSRYPINAGLKKKKKLDDLEKHGRQKKTKTKKKLDNYLKIGVSVLVAVFFIKARIRL